MISLISSGLGRLFSFSPRNPATLPVAPTSITWVLVLDLRRMVRRGNIPRLFLCSKSQSVQNAVRYFCETYLDYVAIASLVHFVVCFIRVSKDAGIKVGD
jgi:hypothetical protein